MKAEAYAIENAVVLTHWWFVVRRRLVARIIAELGIGTGDPVADVGTSSGTNLILLRDMGFTRVAGVDPSTEAIHYCASRGLPPVRQGTAEAMPFDSGSLALVLATDVLEHVEDDVRALREFARVLAPGGHLVVTVPAFPSLWGLQDDVSCHLRRYRRAQLISRAEAAGLEVEECYYFNYLLFVPIWVARQAIKLFKPRISSENQINSRLINAVLLRIFALDVRTARWLKPPFGVSLLLRARRPRQAPILAGGA